MSSLDARAASSGAVAAAYDRLKRVLDLTGALALGIAGAPLFALVALAVYLDDPGPVVFRQTRTGRFHRPFTIYKFRTMRVGTPSLSTEDMRRLGIQPVTRVGRLLRRSSLDELPQVWNIVRGDMSFVGPRPALPTQALVLAGRERTGAHALRPGVTGLAQVTGRDDLADHEKVARDAEYLRDFGLVQDARILWSTFLAVLTGRGAR